MDSLYVSLFSDADQNIFPGNTSSSFRNYLPIPIDLSSGGYEIGVKQVRFEQKSNSVTAKPPSKQKAKNSKPIGPQVLKIRQAVKTTFEFEYKNIVHPTLNGFLSNINSEIEKRFPHFQLKLTIGFDKGLIQTIVELGPPDHWIEISKELADMMGFTTTRIESGEHTGNFVDPSIYDHYGKPNLAIIDYCHLQLKDNVQMKGPEEFGFEPFLNAWHDAISTTKATIGLFDSYVWDKIILSVAMYEKGETMQLSSEMNNLLDLPQDFIFEQDETLVIDKKKFEPDPIPPTPAPSMGSSGYVYLLCDLAEAQMVAGHMVSAIAIMPSTPTNKGIIEKNFDSVCYFPATRTHVSSIGVQLVDRSINLLPAADTVSSCVLHIRKAI